MMVKPVFVLYSDDGRHIARLLPDDLGWVLYIDDEPKVKYAVRKDAVKNARWDALRLLKVKR